MIGREGLHRVWLLDKVAELGGGRPVSFITTGNIAFDVQPDGLDDFVEALEGHVAALIGRHEPVFVRTIEHLHSLVATDPFADTPFGEDAIEQVISFAETPIPEPAVMPVVSRRGDACVFRIDGCEAFGVSRMVGSRTSGSGGLVEQLTGQRVTTRSVGTVRRIAAKEPLA